MTIRQLYNWAKENDALDIPIGIQYQDGGGSYRGDTYEDKQSDLQAEKVEAGYILLDIA